MDTPPFKEAANRMGRPHDQKLFSLLDAEKAVVRLVGPRRIGKTDLVSYYARAKRIPLLCATIKPIPADLAAGPVVLSILEREIEMLSHTVPKLGARIEKIRRTKGTQETRRELGGELKIPGNIAKLSAKAEKRRTVETPGSADADISMASALRSLELAATDLGVRPLVFFDEIQELLVSGESGMATVWAIRNEIQHHTACRYVFAGSNQRLFKKLQEGSGAPLLNVGSELVIPPLTLAEIDAWALPLFRKGGRHIASLAAATALLGGKIGEVSEVCTSLWINSKKDALLDEAAQREAVNAVVRQQPEIEGLVLRLTAHQTTVLRWIAMNPNVSPFTKAANETMKLNAGTVSTSLKTLVAYEFIESFGPNQFVASTPLRLLASLSPNLWAKP